MFLPIVCATLLIQSAAPDVSPDAEIAAFEAAFTSRNLQTVLQPGRGGIKVSIRHALKEGPRGRVTLRFRTFAQVEKWLRSLERGGEEPGEDRLPRREVRSRGRTASGVVEYDNQGIAHNTLYLSRLRFSMSKPGFRILELELYDGD